MYSYNQKAKSDECLICFTKLNKQISLAHLIHSYPICLSCMKKFKIIDHSISFHHYHLRILYEYNDFFKSLLYTYKGQYDLALRDSFLAIFKDELNHLYKDYVITPVPSSTIANEKRGFWPMAQIASTINDHVFLGLYKKEDYKQSDLTFEQRKQVKDKIGIKNKEYLYGKKVLLLDDVITSGATIATCLSLLKTCHPSKIEILVLSSSHW